MRTSDFLWFSISMIAAGACRDVSRFSTGPGESYCGKLVDASFVRRGFIGIPRMRMTFDADRLGDSPGVLSTDDQLLSNAALRPLPELWHDPLSTFNFGEGRDKNLLFAVDPNDRARGPTITVVVSLMHSGDAEVRLVRGAPAVGDGTLDATDGTPLFGVFAPLTREPGQCSF
jgi:hypothetical protein